MLYKRYDEMPNGCQFIEEDRLYIVSKNWNRFMSVCTPVDGFILVFRPDDTGITFRHGTLHESVIVLKDSA